MHSEVFSTHRYWDKVESGELIPAVARDGHGEVIGHVALEREPGAVVAERGEAVVLPAYRGHHLLERMTERLSEEAPKHGLHGIYAEPLTIHTFSQRNDERAGMPVCAVLLGANPESFRPKGHPLPDRRTAPELSPHLPLRAARRRAHDPRTGALSRDAAQDLREPWRDGVGRLLRRTQRAAESRTGIKVNDRGYGVIHFERIGPQCRRRARSGAARRSHARRHLGAALRPGRRSRPAAAVGRGARSRLLLLRPGAGLRRRRGTCSCSNG